MIDTPSCRHDVGASATRSTSPGSATDPDDGAAARVGARLGADHPPLHRTRDRRATSISSGLPEHRERIVRRSRPRLSLPPRAAADRDGLATQHRHHELAQLDPAGRCSSTSTSNPPGLAVSSGDTSRPRPFRDGRSRAPPTRSRRHLRRRRQHDVRVRRLVRRPGQTALDRPHHRRPLTARLRRPHPGRRRSRFEPRPIHRRPGSPGDELRRPDHAAADAGGAARAARVHLRFLVDGVDGEGPERQAAPALDQTDTVDGPAAYTTSSTGPRRASTGTTARPPPAGPCRTPAGSPPGNEAEWDVTSAVTGDGRGQLPALGRTSPTA